MTSVKVQFSKYLIDDYKFFFYFCLEITPFNLDHFFKYKVNSRFAQEKIGSSALVHSHVRGRYILKRWITEDKTDGLLDGGLVGELALEEGGGQEVAELGRLVPTHVLVVNIQLTQPWKEHNWKTSNIVTVIVKST